MDDRIGKLNEDGSVQSYPEKSVRGGRYAHPPTTLRLDATHFVVIDADPDEAPFIEAAREFVKPKVVKKGKVDESGG